jgi:hypothetical protein
MPTTTINVRFQWKTGKLPDGTDRPLVELLPIQADNGVVRWQ